MGVERHLMAEKVTKGSHTPGPWVVDGLTVNSVPGGNICLLNLARPEAATNANGRLIAAAPYLLEALQLVMDTYGFDSSTDSAIWKTAAAAIAKAEGRS